MFGLKATFSKETCVFKIERVRRIEMSGYVTFLKKNGLKLRKITMFHGFQAPIEAELSQVLRKKTNHNFRLFLSGN